MSNSLRLPLEAGGRRWLTRSQIWADRSRWNARLFEALWFTLKQGWACLFGGLLLVMLLGSHLLWPVLWPGGDAPVARYDVLVIGALGIQMAMLALRLESPDEAKVIFLFHLAGTVMELFKTAHGSWVYPEESWLRIGAVPLFSGFMYAAVGSYIARVQRIFHVRVSGWPRVWTSWGLAAAIYVNFFAHHWLPDARILLFAATGLLFWRTRLGFTADRTSREMPVLVGFGLVALMIWVAENIATFSRAWVYPDQAEVWAPVSLHKLGAWFLLMIISVVLVSLVRRPQGVITPPASPCPPAPALAVPAAGSQAGRCG